MWCNHCHYGSDVFTGITRVISHFGINGPESQIVNPPKCPMCKGQVTLSRNPFPKHPTTMGKGGVSQAVRKLNKEVDKNPQSVLTREELLTQMEANHAVLVARGEVVV